MRDLTTTFTGPLEECRPMWEPESDAPALPMPERHAKCHDLLAVGIAYEQGLTKQGTLSRRQSMRQGARRLQMIQARYEVLLAEYMLLRKIPMLRSANRNEDRDVDVKDMIEAGRLIARRKGMPATADEISQATGIDTKSSRMVVRLLENGHVWIWS